jgi:hypothetical protein
MIARNLARFPSPLWQLPLSQARCPVMTMETRRISCLAKLHSRRRSPEKVRVSVVARFASRIVNLCLLNSLCSPDTLRRKNYVVRLDTRHQPSAILKELIDHDEEAKY